jgi:iron complex outermembrane recepter protein
LQLQGTHESENAAFVDHVEIVKGPTSMLYGRVQPGGLVDVVTKRPQATPAFTFEQQAGRWGMLRSTADATGKIDASGTVLYRLIADWDKADSWVDYTHRDNKAVSASLSWRPSSAFDIDLQLEHYDYKSVWLDGSIPVVGSRPADLPRNFSAIFPESWSEYPYRVERTLVGFDWNYRLSDAWKLTQRFHYVRTNEDQQGVFAPYWQFDGVGQFPTVHFAHSPDWVRNTWNTNLDLTGEFTVGAIRHKVLVGIDWFKFTDDTPGSVGDIPGAAPLDIHHPVYPNYSSILAGLAATDRGNTLWRDRTDDTGAYAQDQMSLGERWIVLVGGRYDAAGQSYSNTYGDRTAACYPNCTGYPQTVYPTDRAFSPRAGILYKASETLSFYGSYSKSFGAANGRDALGNALKPQIGKQYELGAKSSLFGGALSWSATLFDLTKSNITEADPATFFPRLVGEARSRGLEIDVTGQLSTHWSVIGSYTYDDARVTKDPYYGNTGHRLNGVAEHVASAWAKYDFAPGAATGWVCGFGAYATTRRPGDDANTWVLPGYGRIDLMAAYRTRLAGHRVSAQLNIDNVADRTYFDHGGFGIASYGAPRSVIGSLKFEY